MTRKKLLIGTLTFLAIWGLFIIDQQEWTDVDVSRTIGEIEEPNETWVPPSVEPSIQPSDPEYKQKLEEGWIPTGEGQLIAPEVAGREPPFTLVDFEIYAGYSPEKLERLASSGDSLALHMLAQEAFKKGNNDEGLKLILQTIRLTRDPGYASMMVSFLVYMPEIYGKETPMETAYLLALISDSFGDSSPLIWRGPFLRKKLEEDQEQKVEKWADELIVDLGGR